VGGGIIGYCCAYYLSEANYRVTIIDATDKPIGASFGNAGMIVPSHFTPLASPALLSKGLKWMLSSSSPFFLRPRLNFELAKWIRKFLKSANNAHVEYASPRIYALNHLSRHLFNEINIRLNDSINFRGDGLMMIYNTLEGEEEELKTSLIANELGLKTEILDNKMLNQKDPGVSYSAKGAVFYPEDAFLDPARLMNALEAYLVDQNVRIIKNSKVKGFEFEGSIIKAVRHREQVTSADQFVIAGGAFTADLLKQLGLRILLQGGKGYSVNVGNPAEMPKICSILTEAKVAITPMGDRLRLAGTMEISGLNTSISKKRVRGFLRSISSYMPYFSYDKLRDCEVWAGLRPCSPDGLPYIGRTKLLQNMVVATGHAMMGLSLGPATGKLVTELIEEVSPTIDLSPFSPDR